jgi:TRAP-type transport system periplasmic protein
MVFVRNRLIPLLAVLALIVAACAPAEDVEDVTAPEDEPEDMDEPAEPEDIDAEEEPEEPAQQVTLIAGHFSPAQHPMHAQFFEPLAEHVAEETEGRVELDVHPGAALGPAPEYFDMTVDGVVDMSYGMPVYTPGHFRLTSVVELPFLFDSAEQASAVLQELYETQPAIQEEFEGVEVLALWTHDLGELFTVDEPVASAEDLAGMSIRSPGPIQNALVERVGATPVTVPVPEAYDALERGVVDGIVIGSTALRSFALQEVINYATVGGFFVSPFFLVVNDDSWNRISAEDQEVIRSWIDERMETVPWDFYDSGYEDIFASLPDEGVEVVELDEAELAEWRAIGEEVIEEWIEEREADGLPAREIYEATLELIE